MNSGKKGIQGKKNDLNNKPSKKGDVLIRQIKTRDFSVIEDSAMVLEELRELGAKAGEGAIAEAKAAGLPRTFVRDNQIIRQYADGHEEIVDAVLPPGKSYYIRSSKRFHAKK